MGLFGFGKKKKEKKLQEEAEALRLSQEQGVEDEIVDDAIEEIEITEEVVEQPQIVSVIEEQQRLVPLVPSTPSEQSEPSGSSETNTLKPKKEKPVKEQKSEKKQPEPKPQPAKKEIPVKTRQEPAPKQKSGVFKKIFGGLAKTASSLGSGISSIFTGGAFDDEFYEDLMAILIQSDMGVEAADAIIDNIKLIVKKQGIKTEQELKIALANSIAELLENFEEDGINDAFEDLDKCIFFVVGVNGVGKTTSIGKMSHHFKQNGKSVLVVAGDTFRAAASEQLHEWTKRAGVRIVKHGEGADPAAVVFDALESAKAKKDDVIFIDTAGRLHNKTHLMEELKKIGRVIERGMPDMPTKKLLVVDATTGQNALSQVEIFNDAVDLDGVILTKLDGTAKGGVVIAIKQKFNLPVLFVGVGEGIDDLLEFDPTAFAKGIVGVE